MTNQPSIPVAVHLLPPYDALDGCPLLTSPKGTDPGSSREMVALKKERLDGQRIHTWITRIHKFRPRMSPVTRPECSKCHLFPIYDAVGMFLL